MVAGSPEQALDGRNHRSGGGRCGGSAQPELTWLRMCSVSWSPSCWWSSFLSGPCSSSGFACWADPGPEQRCSTRQRLLIRWLCSESWKQPRHECGDFSSSFSVKLQFFSILSFLPYWFFQEQVNKSLSEAFILTSTNPQYKWQNIVYWFTSSVHEN